VAILGRPSGRSIPSATEISETLRAAVEALSGGQLPEALGEASEHVAHADWLLSGTAGVAALLGQPELRARTIAVLDEFDARIAAIESGMEERVVDGVRLGADELEVASAALIRGKDLAWSLRQDRLRTADAVAALIGRDATPPVVAGYLAVQLALSAIDRLEVRGRDSAGLHLYVWGHDLDLTAGPAAEELARRSTDPLFPSESVRASGNVLSFVYKAAAEIGELGDNTAALREAIERDQLLRAALIHGGQVAVLGHTRWASVGIISEPNAHPVNSEELDARAERPYVVAALNGDVDNHADLKARHGLAFAAPITTDAKVIPALVSRGAGIGSVEADLVESFRRAAASFDGSVAIGAASAAAPGQVLLALRGSGQGLYVGLAEDCFVVASEPYGLVEVTDTYVRMDGEVPADPSRPDSRGQVVVLDIARAGELGGIRRLAYDGTPLPVTEDDLVRAEVTTRDIDRGHSPHFLLKEMTEAPDSFRKTLRGKIIEQDGLLRAELGPRALPAAVAARLADGSIRKALVIGQGTAAIAGRAMAELLEGLAGDRLDVDSLTATELSGFRLQPDMRDTLVVAVSQSGTTTDTNRTVDLARARGAAVIGIVNRRNSDLTDKADGILYTSDGRDVEMSVASTKAFYAQVAAGALLACAIAEASEGGVADVRGARARHDLLTGLREMPAALARVLELRPTIADAAHRFAPPRRYWAVVGNGPNAVAAHEVRIKLSELCYKSIACDVTEDKKHIDLSSEPLILVCAAGLVGSTADDVAKEVAIYRAHKAAPIVVATEGEERFQAALHVIAVPAVHPALGFVLSAMVGHLFGYEAALAIDGLAKPLRRVREAIEHAVGAGVDGEDVLDAIRHDVPPLTEPFLDGLRSGRYDGHLEASTAVRLVSRLRDTLADSPLEAYQRSSGNIGTPAALIDDLTAALTRGIEELTRPIDAIKHQAKTVTVGISRSDEALVDRPLVREVFQAGTGRDRLTYSALQVLAALDPAVESVLGFTRYRIEGDPASGAALAEIVDRGGISLEIPSRTERDPRLIGNKRRVASERSVLVSRGASDGRTVILVPEIKADQVTGITLLHVQFVSRLPADVARGVLQGWDQRYDRLVDWVTESEGTFREDLLADIDVIDLLTVPVSDLAERWRT
jgi:glucosamine--fructose-6-phosphate aminotransferase (isomerizing)